MKEYRNFRFHNLDSFESVLEHYKNGHGVATKNPVFWKYVENACQDFVELSSEKCSFCSKVLYDSKSRAWYLLKRHLKLSESGVKDLIIGRVGKKFIEFIFDYSRFSDRYEFTDPKIIISDFIKKVAWKLGNREGEIRFICCIVNQFVAQSERKWLHTNLSFSTGIIQGMMNERVKYFFYLKHQKKESW